MAVLYGLLRAPLAEFDRGGEPCRGGPAAAGDCKCDQSTLICKDGGITQSGSTLAAIVLYCVLCCVLLVDMWRARRRVAACIYMANRHTHALLAIAVRAA